MSLLAKPISFCGREVVLVCDGRCDLAWGIERRPRKMLSEDDPDDYVYLGDEDPALSRAPHSFHCGKEAYDFKPSNVALTDLSDSRKMNKWCARQCERSTMLQPHLPDLKNPRPNKSHKHLSLDYSVFDIGEPAK